MFIIVEYRQTSKGIEVVSDRDIWECISHKIKMRRRMSSSASLIIQPCDYAYPIQIKSHLFQVEFDSICQLGKSVSLIHQSSVCVHFFLLL